jgi:ABC-type lipoprotein export system ATPase subunit
MGFALEMVLSCFLIYFVKTVDNSMKVKELYIKKYHQFEDFKLDLTYPKGYKDKDGNDRAGQPLNKVCFIGQSGTGKTSLLEVLKAITYLSARFSKHGLNNIGKYSSVTTGAFDDLLLRDLFLNPVKINFDNDIIISFGKYEWDDVFSQGFFDAKYENIVEDNVDFLLNHFKIFFCPYDILSQNLSDIYSNNTDDSPPKATINTLVDFSTYSSNHLWENINASIIKYREVEIAKSLEIAAITQRSDFTNEELIEASEKFKTWQRNNPNPAKQLADEYLDKVLNKFNLNVKTKLNFSKTEDIKAIEIENSNGETIPFDNLSSGTRQIILSILPFFELKPNKSIVLFDEPERSIYADVQKEIIDIYTSFTTDCQFFYATHSPIIASSFEPWEIVELKFNPKTGKVYQELDYEGERHVDNYKFHPKYLRWDDILGRIFDLEEEGNPERMKALKRLAILESKLKKNSISKEDKEILWSEYSKLSKLTGWTTPMKHEKN